MEQNPKSVESKNILNDSTLLSLVEKLMEKVEANGNNLTSQDFTELHRLEKALPETEKVTEEFSPEGTDQLKQAKEIIGKLGKMV